MKKIRRIKLISVVVLALILMIVLSGTVLAWFMDSTRVNTSGSFTVAEVKLDKTEPEINLYNFKRVINQYDGFMNSIINLEKMFVDDDVKQDELNEKLKSLWDYYNLNDNYLRKSHLNIPRKGGIIEKIYIFTNDSNIPVYFRITKPRLNTDLKIAYFIKINEEYEKYGGYYYWSNPLAAGETVTVKITTYVSHSTNGILISVPDNFITIANAEIIQATNNAVYLHPDWKNAAEQNLFKPYK